MGPVGEEHSSPIAAGTDAAGGAEDAFAGQRAWAALYLLWRDPAESCQENVALFCRGG
jgi:hypothetical protein